MKLRIRLRKPFRRRRERYVPFTRRQRLLVAALALGATLTIALALLAPHLSYLRSQRALQRQDKPACAGGQTAGCVGGHMPVIVVPPAAASQPR